MGTGAGERLHHRFEFASRTGISSRVYRVDYVSCKVSAAEYRIGRSFAGFSSEFRRDDEALLGGATPLKVLRCALRNPGVTADIVDALRDRSIAFCKVTFEADGPRPGLSFYHFLAATGDPEAVVEYVVEYDADRDAATFTRA
jgi:hypothetical protein